jgi:hypothetical protein
MTWKQQEKEQAIWRSKLHRALCTFCSEEIYRYYPIKCKKLKKTGVR